MILAVKATIATSGAEQIVLAVAHGTSPYISVYPWDSGFGAKFADPATLPTTTASFGVTFNANGDYVAIQHTTSPYISAYTWSSVGFGTKFADPATAPTNDAFNPGSVIHFNQVTDDLATAFSTNPDIAVYPFSGSGFGTKYSDPGTAIGGDGSSCRFTADGNEIAVGSASTPYCQVYAWSSGFGAKYANPASTINDPVYGVDFSSDDAYIATGQITSPFADVYAWGPGFGTAYNHPPGLAGINDVAFSNNVDNIVFNGQSSPYIFAFPWSAGYGTQYAAPSPAFPNVVSQARWIADDSVIACTTYSSPYIVVFDWSSGFGTKYANPATLPTGAGYGLTFH